MKVCVEAEPTGRKRFFSLYTLMLLFQSALSTFFGFVLHFNSANEHLEDLQCIGKSEITYVLTNLYESSKFI